MANVKCDQAYYRIVYRGSSNLNAGGESIHKNYNGWIQNLEREIRVELLKI